MNWISVLDRLPDDDTIVLVYAPEAAEPVWLAYCYSDDKSWVWAEGATVQETVTHWMEIPTLPGEAVES